MGIFDWFLKIKKILSEDMKKFEEEEKKNKTKSDFLKGKKENTNDSVLRINWDEIVEFGSKTYYKGTPFTGICCKEEKTFGFDPLIRNTTIENGIKQGPYTVYKDGFLVVKGNYLDGYIHGIIKSYHKNGEISKITEYKHGILDGVETSFDENGSFLTEITWKDNVCDEIQKRKFKEITTEEYKKIIYTNQIDDIKKILSSEKKYEFYFRFTQEYYHCLIQLEKSNSNNKVVSEWNDEFENEFENGEVINGVYSDKDSFDNTNITHKNKQSINSSDKSNLIYVDLVDLYRISEYEFPKRFLEEINKINKKSKLKDLNDFCKEVLEDKTLYTYDPGEWETWMLDGFEHDKVLDKQYLTQNTGHKVSWMRYSQLEGESFEFGYIEK